MDLREALNAISDVITNRPPPLREFDQIYMKAADMLLQAEHASSIFSGLKVAFVGDGDAISLSILHLHQLEILEHGPSHITVFDFDERVINSIRRFSERYGIQDKISGELYNVFDPLPSRFQSSFDAFYTNPPFGASNGGRSVYAFVQRGLESINSSGKGCIVLADDDRFPWPDEVLLTTQTQILEAGFIVEQLIPKFHRYHLDDVPDLSSCVIVIRNVEKRCPSPSIALSEEDRLNFYGKESPLNCHYVRDLRQGNKLPSRDHQLEVLRNADEQT